MKHELKIFALVVLICSTSNTVIKKDASRHFVYKNKYDYSSVTLFNTGKFSQTKHGCTYAFSCKGHWTQNGDTITLNQEKIKRTRGQYREYLNRSNQLILLNDSSVNYLWNIEKGIENTFIMHLELE